MTALQLRVFRDAYAAGIHSLVMSTTVAGWVASFYLMSRPQWLPAFAGVLLCAQSMIWAAYLVHEAAHQALFVGPRLNRIAGEAASFIAGSSYAFGRGPATAPAATEITRASPPAAMLFDPPLKP